MAYNAGNDDSRQLRDIAFNTNALLGVNSFAPQVDYDFLENLPPAPPAPPATQTVNYRTGGGAGAIVRQLVILYDAAGNVSTVTRTI